MTLGGRIVRESLQDISPPNLQRPSTLMVVDWPFNVLIAHGVWNALVLSSLSRWPERTPLRPYTRLWLECDLVAPESDAGDASEDEALLQAGLFEPSRFLKLGDYLRNRATVLVNASNDAEMERAQIREFLQWSEYCVKSTSSESVNCRQMRSTRGGLVCPKTQQRLEYDISFFARALIFAFDFKMPSPTEKNMPGTQKHFMKKMLERALKLMPPALQQACLAVVAEGHFPSPSTISRANLFIDATYMHFMMGVHENMIRIQSIIFGLSDSSPQKGRDYQIIEYLSSARLFF